VKNTKGFTLIELLIVASILGVLVSAINFSFANIQKRARDTKRKSDLEALKVALEAYRADKGKYPETGTWWARCSGPSSVFTQKTDESGSQAYIPNIAPDYIQSLPRDPRENRPTSKTGACSNSTGEQTCYAYKSIDGTEYKILASCGVESVSSVPDTDPYYDYRRFDCNADTGFCAYQVSSSNNAYQTY
jgi:type II secretion system protein G